MTRLQETIDLAMRHHDAGRLDEAARLYLEALRHDADQPDIRQRLGHIVQFHVERATTLAQDGQYRQALECFKQLEAIQPQSAEVHASLGKLSLLLKDTAEASRYLHRYLELDPSDATGARRLLDSIRPADIPDEPDSAEYLREFYDQYAASYDEHLVGELGYQCPSLIAGALKKHGRSDLCVLDLGCGTGLCGKLIKPYAIRIEGVDLSKNMLEKADATAVYDLLLEADINEFLETRENVYDAVIAGGLFEHIGDPAPVFSGVRRALKPGGLFIFTAEDNKGEQLLVNSSGFFTHCRPLLRQAADESGLSVVAMESVVMWQEDQGKVAGLLVSMTPDTEAE